MINVVVFKEVVTKRLDIVQIQLYIKYVNRLDLVL